MTPTEAACVFSLNRTKAPQEYIFWGLLIAFKLKAFKAVCTSWEMCPFTAQCIVSHYDVPATITGFGFGLFCSSVTTSLTAAMVNGTVLVWSFIRACGVKWMQGRPEVAQLCGISAEWLSWKNPRERGVLSIFPCFFFSVFPLTGFWISPPACLAHL